MKTEKQELKTNEGTWVLDADTWYLVPRPPILRGEDLPPQLTDPEGGVYRLYTDWEGNPPVIQGHGEVYSTYTSDDGDREVRVCYGILDEEIIWEDLSLRERALLDPTMSFNSAGQSPATIWVFNVPFHFEEGIDAPSWARYTYVSDEGWEVFVIVDGPVRVELDGGDWIFPPHVGEEIPEAIWIPLFNGRMGVRNPKFDSQDRVWYEYRDLDTNEIAGISVRRDSF